MILVDSNVWAYFFDAAAAEHTKVRKALPRLLGDEELLMPTIVQLEVVHYLVKRLPATASDAVDVFLAQSATVEPLTGGVTTEASRVLLAHRASGIGGRDAAILVMARRREATIMTNDRNLAAVAKGMGVRAINPLSAS